MRYSLIKILHQEIVAPVHTDKVGGTVGWDEREGGLAFASVCAGHKEAVGVGGVDRLVIP